MLVQAITSEQTENFKNIAERSGPSTSALKLLLTLPDGNTSSDNKPCLTPFGEIPRVNSMSLREIPSAKRVMDTAVTANTAVLMEIWGAPDKNLSWHARTDH